MLLQRKNTWCQRSRPAWAALPGFQMELEARGLIEPASLAGGDLAAWDITAVWKWSGHNPVLTFVYSFAMFTSFCYCDFVLKGSSVKHLPVVTILQARSVGCPGNRPLTLVVQILAVQLPCSPLDSAGCRESSWVPMPTCDSESPSLVSPDSSCV